jgi:hypothetical protein
MAEAGTEQGKVCLALLQELRGKLEEEMAAKEAAQTQLKAAQEAHAAAEAEAERRAAESLEQVCCLPAGACVHVSDVYQCATIGHALELEDV